MNGVAAETADRAARPRTAVLDFSAVIAGLLTAGGWIAYSQRLGQTILVDSAMGATAIYYMLVFLPLIVVAAIFSALAGRNPVRRGHDAAFWLPVGGLIGSVGIGVAVGYSWLNGGVVSEPSERAGFAAVLLGLWLLYPLALRSRRMR